MEGIRIKYPTLFIIRDQFNRRSMTTGNDFSNIMSPKVTPELRIRLVTLFMRINRLTIYFYFYCFI